MKLGRLTKVARDLDLGHSRKYELRVKRDGEVAVQGTVISPRESQITNWSMNANISFSGFSCR
jgi:hypothetical protein